MAASMAPPSRERIIVGTSLALVCGLAWIYTLWHAHAMEAMGPMQAAPWNAARTASLFLMWFVMMGAMMLPSVFPMLDAFAAIGLQRRQRRQPYTAIAFFVAGYVLAWSGYSAAATLAQWALERFDLVDNVTMESTSGLLSGVLFIGAGLYQWTPLKQACLARCRSPIGFILGEWREGPIGAVTMGLRHGAFCVGCCAVLMTLLFAVAVMNVLWVAALTVTVAIEKLLPWGTVWRHAIGALLTITGIGLVARTLLA